MNKRLVIFFTLIAILLCVFLAMVARQETNKDYNDKAQEIEATNNQLTIERIRDQNSDSSQMSEAEQRATSVWATTTAIYLRDRTEATTPQTSTSAP